MFKDTSKPKDQANGGKEHREAPRNAQQDEIIAALKSIADEQKRATDQTEREPPRKRFWQHDTKFYLDIAQTIAIISAAAIAVWAISVASTDSNGQRDAMVAQGVTLYGQLLQMKAEGEQQRRVMAAQIAEMVAENRPWLAATPYLTQDVSFRDQNGDRSIYISVGVTMSNRGHSPAAKIRAAIDIYPAPTSNAERQRLYLTSQVTLCAKARSEAQGNPIAGPTIFPSDPPLSLPVMAKGISWSEPASYWIVGCADYSYGSAQHGSTTFGAVLAKWDGHGPLEEIPFPTNPKPVSGWPSNYLEATVPLKTLYFYPTFPSGTIID